MNPETGPRHFENWMNPSEYKEKRGEYVRTAFPILYPKYKNSPYFKDLSDREIQIAAVAMAVFVFGASVARGRMGRKFAPCKRAFLIGADSHDAISYLVGKNKMAFGLGWFLNAAAKIAANTADFSNYTGVKKFDSPFHMFELAGVEETAHYMFVQEKGKDERRRITISTGDRYLDTFTSEPERRALIWKKAYAKHYMPQYYESLDGIQKRVEEAIKKSGHNQPETKGDTTTPK